MPEFLIATILFFDLNHDNIFNNYDAVVQVEESIDPNIYCLNTSNASYMPCGYITQDEDLNLTIINDKDIKSIFRNTELFEKGYTSGRVLYLQAYNDKFLFITEEGRLDKDELIYSYTNNDNFIFDSIFKKLLFLALLIGGGIVIWLFLLPKKVQHDS